eukprot:scaffold1593_cov193-Alexandrium_tamarense.AAC.43
MNITFTLAIFATLALGSVSAQSSTITRLVNKRLGGKASKFGKSSGTTTTRATDTGATTVPPLNGGIFPDDDGLQTRRLAKASKKGSTSLPIVSTTISPDVRGSTDDSLQTRRLAKASKTGSTSLPIVSTTISPDARGSTDDSLQTRRLAKTKKRKRTVPSTTSPPPPVTTTISPIRGELNDDGLQT